MKKSATFVLVSAVGLSLSLAATAPAGAEPTHTQEEIEINIYEDGSIVDADAPQHQDSAETILSNGLLPIRTTGCTYVRVSYVKDSSSPVDLSFDFYNSGNTHTSGDAVGFMDVPGQQQSNLPPVDCD